MTTKDNALRMAIEAIENYGELLSSIGILIDNTIPNKTIEACKAALSDIEKCEPVAKLGRWKIDKSTGTEILTLDNCSVIEGKYAHYIMGLLQKEIDKVVSELENTSPQPRDWVGLTDEDIKGLPQPNYDITTAQYVKIIEAKIRELNFAEKG